MGHRARKAEGEMNMGKNPTDKTGAEVKYREPSNAEKMFFYLVDGIKYAPQKTLEERADEYMGFPRAEIPATLLRADAIDQRIFLLILEAMDLLPNDVLAEYGEAKEKLKIILDNDDDKSAKAYMEKCLNRDPGPENFALLLTGALSELAHQMMPMPAIAMFNGIKLGAYFMMLAIENPEGELAAKLDELLKRSGAMAADVRETKSLAAVAASNSIPQSIPESKEAAQKELNALVLAIPNWPESPQVETIRERIAELRFYSGYGTTPEEAEETHAWRIRNDVWDEQDEEQYQAILRLMRSKIRLAEREKISAVSGEIEKIRADIAGAMEETRRLQQIREAAKPKGATRRKRKDLRPRWGEEERRLYDVKVHDLIMAGHTDRSVAREVVKWAEQNPKLSQYKTPSESMIQKWAKSERAFIGKKRKRAH